MDPENTFVDLNRSGVALMELVMEICKKALWEQTLTFQ
jgi:Asp-tRNA(Asn)/Glu-tRNA(Gln) amidotransferase B subunit